MVKKISSIILAAVILCAGYFAQRKLNFWERSIAVFKLNTQEQQFERGMGRGRGGFAGEEGFRQGRGIGIRGGREIPDSLVRNIESRDFPSGGMRHSGGFARGESRLVKKINLRTIQWHLAIFASFTLIVIYIDKSIRYIRKRSNIRPESGN